MRVRVLRTFRDLKGSAVRKKGDVFEVTKKRLKEINSTEHGALVEPVEEPGLETEKEEQPNGQDD